MTTVTFKVRGPFDVPHWVQPGGRSIDNDCAKEFFDWHPRFAKATGVYVFGMRFGAKVRPWYVGKATKSFRQECFAPQKLMKYGYALAAKKLGTPCLFFVSAPSKHTSATLIGRVEREMIRLARQNNPNLLNIVGVKPSRWAIQGVLRGNAGQKSASAHAFAAAMGLR